MKLLGAFIIIVTSTLLGWEFARRFTRRKNQIRQLRLAFEALEGEMVFSMAPLSDACQKVAVQSAAPINQLFSEVSEKLTSEEKSAPDIWADCLKKWKKKTDLEAAEINILEQFGQTIGQQDIETQRNQIRLAITYFEQEEKHAQESEKKYESMYRSLGFLGGVLIVIIMM
ncbi:stage III sporulation protein AB [Bacillus shivajii]|uniref:stage III sporulation protein SpoIIIAB n=1 Tax=Bacillus shivajii TaxID=1983719 RepID=UPI001CFBA6E1|nr:stage III sporulation protein SpoIIIAB [Bacillus shivajii]UCZ54598.1 stage III sporulation protein AB [Bacillus shivajii]